MEDIQDVDAFTEAEGRRLLAAAFETVPAGTALAGNGLAGDGLAGIGLAGAELLRRVRRRTSRRRARTLVPAGAVAAVGGAVALSVMLTATVASAPSAFAAVTAAATKTSAESFSITSTEIYVTQGIPGASRDGKQTTTGVFDLGHDLGEEIVNGMLQVRFVGGHEYSKGPTPTDGKPWLESLMLPPLSSGSASGSFVGSFSVGTGFAHNEPIDPGALLGLLKSAGSVQAEGPASGPGWTGTKYAFTIRWHKVFRASGTVYVDNQGRVRRLVTTDTFLRPAGAFLTITYDVTFGNFGVRVSVTAPPASQVHNRGNESPIMNSL